ncbi:hypothetical protein [Methanococcus voltae]|uniref:Uncharacterized protein n=2 Tax=Methanococcus voltae TaxID=2188 RepID=A0A8J7UUP8_METVO|nr:hypothetical protein [Methanococcus voltae]MBP2172537.1 hypothetical protein [Methanococcus voltae]MBP2201556.1 hypothetical protein [Methanococcus voltae]MCS3922345.1 hypothetical protein [Methanococcus voltae PS]
MIEIITFQEVKSNDKHITEVMYEKFLKELKEKYPKMEIISEDYDEEVDENKNNGTKFYTKILEMKLTFETFTEYIKFCMEQGADLEVMKPSKITISSKEFGELLLYIIEFFNKIQARYDISYSVESKPDIEYTIEELKEGIYDEDDIYDFIDDGYIDTKFVLKGFGKSEKEVVSNILKTISEDMYVNKVITQPMELENNSAVGNMPKPGFSGLIALEVFGKPFEIVEFTYKYLPVTVKFQDKDIELEINEIQDIGNDLGGAIFELSHAAANM